MFLLAILVVLASVFPAGLEEEANPLETPAHIKPEWYFLAVYELLKHVPRLDRDPRPDGLHPDRSPPRPAVHRPEPGDPAPTQLAVGAATGRGRPRGADDLGVRQLTAGRHGRVRAPPRSAPVARRARRRGAGAVLALSASAGPGRVRRVARRRPGRAPRRPPHPRTLALAGRVVVRPPRTCVRDRPTPSRRSSPVHRSRRPSPTRPRASEHRARLPRVAQRQAEGHHGELAGEHPRRRRRLRRLPRRRSPSDQITVAMSETPASSASPSREDSRHLRQLPRRRRADAAVRAADRPVLQVLDERPRPASARPNDTQVAICIDCHGSHDVKKASDPTPEVYPLNVPNLSRAATPTPTRWSRTGSRPTSTRSTRRASTAGRSSRKDIRAPTCASCHGSHAAKPPRSSEVVDVCGKCHTATQALYLQSRHAELERRRPKCWTCHGTHDVAPARRGLFFHPAPPRLPLHDLPRPAGHDAVAERGRSSTTTQTVAATRATTRIRSSTPRSRRSTARSARQRCRRLAPRSRSTRLRASG